MPTYDFTCKACNHTFEEMQHMSASPLIECPSCKEPALIRKIGAGIGLSFTGSGFYQTDYKSCCPCGKKESCKS